MALFPCCVLFLIYLMLTVALFLALRQEQVKFWMDCSSSVMLFWTQGCSGGIAKGTCHLNKLSSLIKQ